MRVRVDAGVARLVDGDAIAGGTAHLLDVVRCTVDAGVPLELAVRSHRIPNNQARGVELPALPSKSERDKTLFLDEREVWALADAAGDFSLSVLVLAWCGLRFGELAALRGSDFARALLRDGATDRQA